MTSSSDLVKKYGSPIDDARTTNVNEQTKWEMQNMVIVPTPINLTVANPVLPKKLYAHKKFAPIIIEWLQALYDEDCLLNEINEWNGCFNVRLKRGLSSLSLHAFGCAVDVNAKNNPLGLSREKTIKRGLKPFSEAFIALSRMFFDCGADFKRRPDGMHFQIKTKNI